MHPMWRRMPRNWHISWWSTGFHRFKWELLNGRCLLISWLAYWFVSVTIIFIKSSVKSYLNKSIGCILLIWIVSPGVPVNLIFRTRLGSFCPFTDFAFWVVRLQSFCICICNGNTHRCCLNIVDIKISWRHCRSRLDTFQRCSICKSTSCS